MALSPGGVALSPGGVALSPGGVALSPGGVALYPGGVALFHGGVALSPGGVALSPGGVALSPGGAISSILCWLLPCPLATVARQGPLSLAGAPITGRGLVSQGGSKVAVEWGLFMI